MTQPATKTTCCVSGVGARRPVAPKKHTIQRRHWSYTATVTLRSTINRRSLRAGPGNTERRYSDDEPKQRTPRLKKRSRKEPLETRAPRTIRLKTQRRESRLMPVSDERAKRPREAPSRLALPPLPKSAHSPPIAGQDFGRRATFLDPIGRNLLSPTALPRAQSLRYGGRSSRRQACPERSGSFASSATLPSARTERGVTLGFGFSLFFGFSVGLFALRVPSLGPELPPVFLHRFCA